MVASTLPHRSDMTWQDRSDCRNADDGDWEMEPDAQPSATNRAAIAVCAECPVRRECLDFALRTERPWPRWGIWGGATPRHRERIARPGRAGAEQTA